MVFSLYTLCHLRLPVMVTFLPMDPSRYVNQIIEERHELCKCGNYLIWINSRILFLLYYHTHVRVSLKYQEN